LIFLKSLWQTGDGRVLVAILRRIDGRHFWYFFERHHRQVASWPKG